MNGVAGDELGRRRKFRDVAPGRRKIRILEYGVERNNLDSRSTILFKEKMDIVDEIFS